MGCSELCLGSLFVDFARLVPVVALGLWRGDDSRLPQLHDLLLEPVVDRCAACL